MLSNCIVMYNLKSSISNKNVFNESMSTKSKGISSSTVLVSLAGISACYLVAKYHTRILKKIRVLLDYRNPLRHQLIEVVNNTKECTRVISQLKRHCNEYNVIGFDCEWVTVGGSRRPIALLQLASHNGLCALFRLNLLKHIPPELRQILEDDNIIKVGVSPYEDANYLARDYGVCVGSTLDLRYLATMAKCEAGGLARLSQAQIGVKLEKNWRVRCSNWEANDLTPKQMQYAANDAHVAVEIFRTLARKISGTSKWCNEKEMAQSVLDRCFTFLDMKYTITKYENMPPAIQSGQSQTSTNKSPLFKPCRRNYTRAKPLYHNCYLEAPDGEALCTCSKKKAKWYVDRSLGVAVTEDPYTVRLNFQPERRAGNDHQYYKTPKINQCVVCGENNSYIRKNVVPREYRRYFPLGMKDHTSHDILLLCPSCHQLSNCADLSVRTQLAKKCNAPLNKAEHARKTIEVPRLKIIKSTAKTLYHQKTKLPTKRYEELKATFLSYYPENTELTDALLEEAMELKTTEPNENYEAHGSKVVEYYATKKDGLLLLERLWRENFLQVMRPKFLPEFWSIDHNHEHIYLNNERNKEENSQFTGISNKLIADENDGDRYDSENDDSMMSQPPSTAHSFDDDEAQVLC